MKKPVQRVLCLLLCVLIMLPTALAEQAAYPDIEGHWAQPILIRAVDDGYLTGIDGNLMPDGSIDRAQAATIINRVLKAEKRADISAVTDVPEGSWYRAELEKASELGYINVKDASTMKKPLTRAETMIILSRAFQLTEADPDYALLSAFSDGGKLTGEGKNAAAALVKCGAVTGTNGALLPWQKVTRAEFTAILYRIIDAFSLTGCAGGEVTLGESGSAVIRGGAVTSFKAPGSYETLVLAQSAGDIRLTAKSAGCVILGAGGGKTSVACKTDFVSVTGPGRAATVERDCGSVAVSGPGAKLTIDGGTKVGEVKIMPGAVNSEIVINGTVEKLTVLAAGCKITGSGRVAGAEIDAPDCQASVGSAGTAGSVSLTAPQLLAAGEKLTVTAESKNASGVGKWYVDGKSAGGEAVELKSGDTAEISPQIKYAKKMAETMTVGFSLTSVSNGSLRYIYTSADIQLENYPPEHYRADELKRVNALVTTYVYEGNKNNTRAQDYAAADKELWVSGKGYTSSTDYLVWVSLACQKVNVFKKADGGWSLIKTFDCASGASSTPTPTGTYKITYHQDKWQYNGYWCGPITGIIRGYAFHSWLNNNDGSARDHTMGRPVSHGCLRMKDEGARYMFTLPMQTTVVIY